MTAADIVASAGVALMLGAFVLNVVGVLAPSDRRYLVANAVGGALACACSIMIGFLPFIILEAAWTLAALYSLARPSAATTTHT